MGAQSFIGGRALQVSARPDSWRGRADAPKKAHAAPKLEKAGSVTVTAYQAGAAVWLRNTNDVIIELHASEKSGLAVTGGANGVLVQFEA